MLPQNIGVAGLRLRCAPACHSRLTPIPNLCQNGTLWLTVSPLYPHLTPTLGREGIRWGYGGERRSGGVAELSTIFGHKEPGWRAGHYPIAAPEQARENNQVVSGPRRLALGLGPGR